MKDLPRHEPSEFQRFEALARKILTTPKAELLKDAPKKASKARKGKKK